MIYIKDVFKEQLVKKELGNSAFLARLGIIFCVILLTFILLILIILFPWFQIIFPAILVFALYIGYRMLKSLNVEFEYAVTNNELDIDTIRGKAVRKRIFECDLRNIEAFRPAGSSEFGHSFNTSQKYISCVSNKDAKAYEFLASYKEKKVIISFEPNEEMLEHITKYLKRGAYKL